MKRTARAIIAICMASLMFAVSMTPASAAPPRPQRLGMI